MQSWGIYALQNRFQGPEESNLIFSLNIWSNWNPDKWRELPKFIIHLNRAGKLHSLSSSLMCPPVQLWHCNLFNWCFLCIKKDIINQIAFYSPLFWNGDEDLVYTLTSMMKRERHVYMHTHGNTHVIWIPNWFYTKLHNSWFSHLII